MTRKRVAVILILTLCMMMCPGMRNGFPAQAAEIETEVSETSLPASESYAVKRFRHSLIVKDFGLSTKDNQSVLVQWRKNPVAVSYQIYRAENKNGNYKVVQTVAGTKNSYVDREIKPCKKYYYRIKASGTFEGNTLEGKFSSMRSICVSGIATPKISVKKGTQGDIRYITVIFRTYQGKYADICISFDGKKYKNLKLHSNKISKYQGRFKIRYTVKKKTIWFKVKTYQKKGKEKRYSNFSNVAKVKV